MNAQMVGAADNSGDRSPTAPIKIAFCITDLDVGGAERMFVELVTRLNRDRWEPRVFCLSRPGALVDRLARHNVPVRCFGATGIGSIQVFWKLAAELKSFRPLLLQTFLFHANIVGRFAARWARVPRVVCGIRVAERRSRWPLWLDRFTQRLVDHNICVSRGVVDFSRREGGVPESKLSCIPNAVDFDVLANASPLKRAELGLTDSSPLILFVGRLDPQKAPFVLLEAFARLHARHSDWQLLFVGEGPLRQPIEDWIQSRRLQNNIRLAGWRPDVGSILKTANVLALPSLWEGMPNIVLESMAAGLPVVASRVEGTDELIIDGESGLLVTPGSDVELEQQLEAVLTNEELAARLRNSAKSAVKSTFSCDRMVASYERLYLQLLSMNQLPLPSMNHH
jgi:glycosyltransferase involved in cell wall biosynthesis